MANVFGSGGVRQAPSPVGGNQFGLSALATSGQQPWLPSHYGASGGFQSRLGAPIQQQGKTAEAQSVLTGIGAQATALRAASPTGGQLTPTPTARQWAPYNVGAAPQVATTPWDASGGSYRDFISGAATPRVTAPAYDETVNGPMLIDPNGISIDVDQDYNLGQWVDAISAQAMFGQEARIEAAREQQVARGMGRSGAAILSEDAVIRDTQIQIQQAAATAAVEQARLNASAEQAYAQLQTERELSNQRAYEAWNVLTEQAQQFKASQEMEAALANQAAEIEMRGMGMQYAGILSQLETERVLANQQTQQSYAQMQMTANLAERENQLQAEISRAELEVQNRSITMQYGASGAQGQADWAAVQNMAQSLMESGAYDGGAIIKNLMAAFPSMTQADWNSQPGRLIADIVGGGSPRVFGQ